MSLSKSDVEVLKSVKDNLFSAAQTFFSKTYSDKTSSDKSFIFFRDALNRILSEAEFSASLSSGLSREQVLNLLIHSPDFVHQFFGIRMHAGEGHMLYDFNMRSIGEYSAKVECDAEPPLIWGGREWGSNESILLKARVYWRDGGNHFRVKLSFPDRTVEPRGGAHSQYIVLLPKTALGKAVFGFILSDPSVLLDAFRVKMSRFRPEKTMNAISLYSSEVVQLSGSPGFSGVWPGSEKFV